MTMNKLRFGLFLLAATLLITSCGKRKDKKDELTVYVNDPLGNSTLGAEVNIYATNASGANELYLSGTTGTSSSIGESEVKFVPEDRLFVINDSKGIDFMTRCEVFIGDSISNVNGDGSYITMDMTHFNEKMTDMQNQRIYLTKSYSRFLKGTTWTLRRGAINGLSATLDDCALDNTLTFPNDDSWVFAAYDEGSSICEDVNPKVNVNLDVPANFSDAIEDPFGHISSTIRTSGVQTTPLDPSSTIMVESLHIIYPDTLVLRSVTSDATARIDYFFTK